MGKERAKQILDCNKNVKCSDTTCPFYIGTEYNWDCILLKTKEGRLSLEDCVNFQQRKKQ